MSHYTEMKVSFLQKNEKELIEALQEQFGKQGVEVHDMPQDLRTYTGSNASTGTKSHGNRAERCHLIIRQEALRQAGGSITNDAGYRRNTEGTYDAHLDVAGYTQKMQNAVAQDYTRRVAEKQLLAKGYRVQTQTLPNGEVEVVGVKY